MPFENILVGLSDDNASTEALRGAALYSQKLGARLHLAHAAISEASWSEERLAIRARVAYGLEGTRFEEELKDDALVVKIGEPNEVLLDEAKRVGADMIVVGPHRKRPFDFGSTARGLMKDSTVPILVQVGAPRSNGALMVGVDLTSGSKLTLSIAHQLAGAMGSKLILLHCYQGPSFASYESSAAESAAAPNYVIDADRKAERDEFEAFVAAYDWGQVDHVSVFVEDDPAVHILDHQKDVDIIVVGRHGHRGIFGSLGSLSGQLHKKISSPLLIVPHE